MMVWYWVLWRFSFYLSYTLNEVTVCIISQISFRMWSDLSGAQVWFAYSFQVWSFCLSIMLELEHWTKFLSTFDLHHWKPCLHQLVTTATSQHEFSVQIIKWVSKLTKEAGLSIIHHVTLLRDWRELVLLYHHRKSCLKCNIIQSKMCVSHFTM